MTAIESETRPGGRTMPRMTKGRLIRPLFAVAAILLLLAGWESYRHLKRFSAGTLASLVLLGLCFAILGAEIKKRKRAQAVQRESEKWLSIALGSIGDAVIATDNNGAVTLMNPVAQGLTGWSFSDARGKSLELVFDIVSKETRLPAENPANQVLHSENLAVPAGHTLLLAKGGREFDIEDSAAPILTEIGNRQGALLIFRDITELKRTREELDQFFTLSMDMICIAGYDGYFKQLNPAWEKILGYTKEELLSRPFLEFVHADDREAALREADKLRSGANTLSFVNRYICKDGSYKWLLWSGTLSPERQLIYAVARDITELKQTQKDLVRAKEEAERSNRFKDQFLSTMSHELRTPLNAVLGFSDLLREESYGPLNERQKRYVDHIRTGGRHLLRLINDILDLSKIEAGRVQLAIDSVPVNASIAEIVDALRPLADKKRQTVVQSAARDLRVRADVTRFKQMLMNLLGNAIKFTPEGGRIEVNARKTGEFVRVDVRDTGPGIPIEEQQQIFEPFYRARIPSNTPEGTGLGLAITRRLAELQGGRLGLESEVGKGSCFHFTLPASAYLARDEIPDAEPAPATASSRRILVVEDDLAAAQLLESQLASAGYNPVVCRQPERAAAMAVELQPAAVTLDILMKPVNGWEVLLTLKSDPRTARIPVIVVSVVDQEATGSLLGADEYIVKPVDKAILTAAVENCLSRLGRMGPGRSILVVDDDAAAREFIGAVLARHGYRTSSAADGAEARARVTAGVPDLVILDLMLPDVSGFQLLAEWRENPCTAELPVFVLTNKELTAKEKNYILMNAGAFFQKQERWQELLLRQVSRAVCPAPLEVHEA